MLALSTDRSHQVIYAGVVSQSVSSAPCNRKQPTRKRSSPGRRELQRASNKKIGAAGIKKRPAEAKRSGLQVMGETTIKASRPHIYRVKLAGCRRIIRSVIIPKASSGIRSRSISAC
jgi:hypothetical protein